MDENRVFATTTNCPGCPNVPTYAGTPVDDFTALVMRDRNHPSVVWWSFCNEAGCGQGGTEPALDFRLAAYANDGSRFVGANMGWLSPITPTNMSALLDVMGFSHASYNSIVNFHQLVRDGIASRYCVGCNAALRPWRDTTIGTALLHTTHSAGARQAARDV